MTGYTLYICDNFYSNVVQENLTLYKADGDSEEWKAYISYVDDMLVEGFFSCIYCSLNYLIDNTEVCFSAFVAHIIDEK